jgi:hypothetical protein
MRRPEEGATVPITKLDVVEKEIVAAVHLLFDGGDPIPVYALAAAAREITTKLCEKRGLRSMVDAIQEAHPHMTRKDIYREASKHAAFFKHADRDPNGVLDDFDPTEADSLLWMAYFDFRRLCGRKPVEGDAFELWFFAKRDLLGALKLGEIAELRGITTAPRPVQIEMGKRFLVAARAHMAAVKA